MIAHQLLLGLATVLRIVQRALCPGKSGSQACPFLQMFFILLSIYGHGCLLGLSMEFEWVLVSPLRASKWESYSSGIDHDDFAYMNLNTHPKPLLIRCETPGLDLTGERLEGRGDTSTPATPSGIPPSQLKSLLGDNSF